MERWQVEGELIRQLALRAGLVAAIEAESRANPAVTVIAGINAALASAADQLDVLEAGRLRAVIQGLLDAAEGSTSRLVPPAPAVGDALPERVRDLLGYDL